MRQLDVLDADGVRRWAALSVALLTARREEIDRLNVFPVADRDTGTNLLVTLRAAHAALLAEAPVDGDRLAPARSRRPQAALAEVDDEVEADAVEADQAAASRVDGPGADPAAVAALGRFADGAVLGAAGNSGTIVAELLRGLADAAADRGRLDAVCLHDGFVRGAVQARHAVARPVGGTVLTVAAAVAAGLAAAVPAAAPVTDVPSDTDGMLATATRARELAYAALALTTGQLPELARAGVVDAGARGWTVVLDALVETLREAAGASRGGRAVPTDGTAAVPASIRPPTSSVAASPAFPDHADPAQGPAGSYEVQFLLDVPATSADGDGDPAADLRAALARIADSVVVGTTAAHGGARTWNVHAHTDDAGAVLEAALGIGRAHRISIGRLDARPVAPGPYPVADPTGAVPAGAVPAGAAPAPSAPSIVVVAPGPGTAALFGAEGVVVIDTEPGTAAARVCAAVVAAVHADPRSRRGGVVLLPGSAAVRSASEDAAAQLRADDLRVALVPTRSPVQALAAVAVHDPGRRLDDDVVAMAEAAAATRVAALAVAEGESLTSAGRCQAGDVLGLIDGEVVEIGRGVLAVALAVTDRLLGVGAELMTVLVAADAGAGVAEMLRRHVRERSPFTEVSIYPAGPGGVGPDRSPILIGVE